MKNAETQKILADNYNSEFWKACRSEAWKRLKAAINSDGSLSWSKLPKLLGNNPKIEKGEKAGYATAIMHLAPSYASGVNVCAMASIGCGMACLNEAGHGQRHMMHNGKHAVHIARVLRTFLYEYHRHEFLRQLDKEIKAHKRRAEKNGFIPAVRLNGTSDIVWEKKAPQLFADNPGIIFYDYTKIPGRNVSAIDNYSLTFSLNESNRATAIAELKRGINVAAVFRVKPGNKNKPGGPLPARYAFGDLSAPVIDGDVSDLRFTDQAGVIVGLRAKGDAFSDDSGFVLEPV